MKYVGVDLHKKTISACVVVKECERRQVAARAAGMQGRIGDCRLVP
jgi:hypothetical protein